MELWKKLREVFPEFDRIQDSDLRERALTTLVDAMQQGGWSVEDLDKIPFTLLIPDCPVSYVAHVRSVTQVAIKTAEVLSEQYSQHYSLDTDLLVTGALLHDVGKLLEFCREGSGFAKSKSGKLLRHPFSGAGLATKHGLPDEVVHMIATHAKEGDGGYRSPESVIVHHADFVTFEPLRDEVR